MNTQEYYEMFVTHTFFKGFNIHEFEELIEATDIQTFEKKEFVFEKHDDGDSMFLLIEGMVKIVNFSIDGKEQLVNRLYPGEILGEISLLDRRARTASAYCAKNSKLLNIKRDRMMEFLEKYPKFYKSIIEQLCVYLRAQTETIEDFAFLDRYQKIARVLIRAIDKQVEVSSMLRISQEEIGHMLGFSREIVNKSLQELQAKKLILLGRSRIEILDQKGLTDLIEEGV